MEHWLGLLHLQFKDVLVFSSLTVENRCDLFCSRFLVRRLELVFLAYGPTTVSKKTAVNKITSTVGKKDASYEYWEVLSPPLCTLILTGYLRIYLHIVSHVVILRGWVCDNLV